MSGIFQLDGQKMIIDVRARVAKGEHPRGEILNAIKTAPVGTIFEIHLPHRGEPLIANLQSFGMNVIVNEIEPMHFRLMAVKLDEF
ncbi:amino acid decarboxylase [Neobacillus mesonae]|uniref:amino acid decarboxylase n=1 Tax=Neobacillus mesonae TaxID=1193713 RepID=UPI00203C0A08|nr:amino acid decarboxylase [Neobacillus mesonae]MCM3569172.1 amino acid decarboxylase [Neobacillus mesonae]